MTERNRPVTPTAHSGPSVNGTPTVAPLTNVGLAMAALERARNRSISLPGIVVLYGPSGWGKSTAAAYAASNQAMRAYYVEMNELWDKRDFLRHMALEVGVSPDGKISAIAEAVSKQLALSERPLIIDEAGVLMERAGGDGLVKGLYEMSKGAVMLVGEETLPARIARHERLHGRVLEWIGAQPATMADARALTRIYCPAVDVADDLLKVLAERAKGSIRRIVVNLDAIHQEARKVGWTRVDLAAWGQRPIYTGEAAARRVG